ncbi:MAG: MFS transporter [Candidatus Korobacteraceae bacterium]
MSEATQATSQWLGVFDQANLTPRYWATITLVGLQEMFEFYDFFLVGYLVAVLAPSWHLTYGQSSLMLLSAGVGSIVGALVFGKWSDRIGRKRPIAWGGVIFSAGCGACALIPGGSWFIFSICRFAVGFGLAGAVTTQNALVVEMTPTRYRTFLSSMMLAPASVGITLSAFVASALLPLIGWRWLCATGALPIFISLGVWLWVPESVRWLLTQNRFEEARREAARQLGVAVESVKLPSSVPVPVAPVPLTELLQDQRRFWWVIFTWTGIATSTFGVQLWGPTILSQLLRIPPATAAKYFIALAIMGFFGRIMFSVLPMHFGRRRSGQIQGLCSALVLLTAALFYREFILGWSVFALCIITVAFFLTGGYANMLPYTLEAYPVRLSARGLGLGQAMNGIGKVLGPLCLALIAGSSNMVSSKATEAAVRPAFFFLAACSFTACITYTLFRVETHGRPLNLRGEAEAKAAAAPTR